MAFVTYRQNCNREKKKKIKTGKIRTSCLIHEIYFSPYCQEFDCFKSIPHLYSSSFASYWQLKASFSFLYSIFLWTFSSSPLSRMSFLFFLFSLFFIHRLLARIMILICKHIRHRQRWSSIDGGHERANGDNHYDTRLDYPEVYDTQQWWLRIGKKMQNRAFSSTTEKNGTAKEKRLTRLASA